MLNPSILKLSNIKTVGPSLASGKRRLNEQENQYLPDSKFLDVMINYKAQKEQDT